MPSRRDGGEQAGWLPAGGLGLQEAGKGAHHSQRHTGKGLPRHRHQPQQQQHCSHGDRKERTRLDQSRLEQTPPTIIIIHNPHLLPPPSTAASHVYPKKNSGQVQCLQRQKSGSQRGQKKWGRITPQSTRTQETQSCI